MANMKISELPLRSTFDDNCSIPIDDGTQSFRVKGDQIRPGLRIRMPVRTVIAGSGNFIVPSLVTQLTINVEDPKLSFSGASDGGVAIDSGGKAWAWGENAAGELGAGNITLASSPVAVIGGHYFSSVAARYFEGPNVTILRKSNGTLWAFGENTYGTVGDGSTTHRSSPVAVIGGHSFVKAVVGVGAGFALKSDGTAWAWGNDQNGGLGQGPLEFRSSPVQVIGGHSFVDLDVAIGLKSNGSAWCWGPNDKGQLGIGSTANQSSPIAVIGGHSFVKVVASGNGSNEFKGGLKADGSVWTWGDNTNGRLGDGTATHRSSPVQVIGGHSFIDVAMGVAHMAALKANGSVYSWGYNGLSGFTGGALGDGTVIPRSSPVAVIGGHSFIEIHCGSGMSLALKADGSVWTWGDNGSGALGDGTRTYRSSPVAVIGGKTFGAFPTNQRFYTMPVTPGQVIPYTKVSFGSISFGSWASVSVEYMGLDNE